MDIDAVLTLASLVSFFALVISWVAVPPHAAEPLTEATQPAAA